MRQSKGPLASVTMLRSRRSTVQLTSEAVGPQDGFSGHRAFNDAVGAAPDGPCQRGTRATRLHL
jgi:hypothetical protein